jgi:hypothetical protein
LNWETPRSHRGHPRIHFTIKPQKSDSFYSLNQKKKPLNPGLAPGLKSGLTSCAQPALTLPQRRSVRVATAALLVAHDDFSPQVRVGPVDVLGCLGFGGARLDPPNGERLTLPRDEPLAVSRPEQGHVPARGSTSAQASKQATGRCEVSFQQANATVSGQQRGKSRRTEGRKGNKHTGRTLTSNG